MITDQTTKPEVLFTESPSSWNTRYITKEGFVCQITIRGENGKDLLEKADVALRYLIEHGYAPDTYQRRNGKSNGNGQGKQCPIHQCWMNRYEKEGKTWFSHKLDDGSWCYGKQSKKEG
jgi:hypothetical protein